MRLELLAEFAVTNPWAIHHLDGVLVFPDPTEILVARLVSRIL